MKMSTVTTIRAANDSCGEQNRGGLGKPTGTVTLPTGASQLVYSALSGIVMKPLTANLRPAHFSSQSLKD
jgi:hypothetical protein